MASKKIVVVLVLLLTVSLFSVFDRSFAARGTISITFDDGWQTQYDYAFPLLQARGIKATFYVNTARINTPNFMTVSELQTLQNNGHEIGSHSHNHVDFPYLSDSQIVQECQTSKQMLQSWGLAVNNFAYPDGLRNAYTDSKVIQYYRSARSWNVGPYLMYFPLSQSMLPAFRGENGNSNALTLLKDMIDQIYSTNSWGIIDFHFQPTNNSNNISPEYFRSFLDYIQTKGVSPVTVNQGLNLSNPPTPTATPTPNPTPTATPTPNPTPTATPTPNPTPTATPTPNPTPTATPTPNPTPTATPDPTPTATPDPTPSPTPTLEPTMSPTPIPSPSSSSSPLQTYSPSPTPTLKPTPLPSPVISSTLSPISTTIQAKLDSGSNVDLVINGNITSSQMSNVTISADQTIAKTTVSFSLTGQSGTTGFGNVTIPKNELSYGTLPTIYIDGKPTLDQGYVQGANNYYIWFTTHFSTHKVTIEFELTPNSTQSQSQLQSSPQDVIYGVTVAVVIVAIVAVAFVLRKKQER